jgi:RNA polymerase sigma factor (sigma-70 family)
MEGGVYTGGMATTAPLLSDLELQYPGPRAEECSDETLAHLVAEASEPAFAALYERHYQALYRYCRSIVRDDTDAQDVLQSAWTRALVALRRGQRDAPVRPWLYRIVHNEAISLLRRRGRGVERPVLATDRVPSAEDRALDRERFWALLADLRQLPERPRGALLMRELSGLSHEEIAVALETSVSAAKQSIYEARRDLVELAAGRATPCDDICRHISDGDRRVLRGRRVAAHLRACPSCSDFATAIDTRTTDLHALAPWLAPVAATAVLEGAFRAGWGAGAAATSAGAAATTGAAGSGAGAAGAAGATGVAATPAAVTAGVVTKAVGVPLLGKSLLAVVAVTAGVASAVGAGGGHHALSPAGPTHALLRSLTAAGAARAAHIPLSRHAGSRAPAGAASASRAGAHGGSSHRSVPTPGASRAGASKASRAGAAHRRSAPAAVHGAGRHVASGQASNVPPGQVKKVTTTPPGHAKTTTPSRPAKKITTPPGQANKGTATPPGHTTAAAATPPGHTKHDATPSGQAKNVTAAASGQVKKVTTTGSGPAEKPATPPSGPARPADALPPGHSGAPSTAGNSAAHAIPAN